ncbi:hypothetical protein AB4Y32_17485 [Paraburkholderia phymatum]|uniref:Uncharacterized protein n=1 Tax=Paraburkholderia phymatum TaxID=148447 RepID=A0ACC6U1X1_9BURK
MKYPAALKSIAMQFHPLNRAAMKYKNGEPHLDCDISVSSSPDFTIGRLIHLASNPYHTRVRHDARSLMSRKSAPITSISFSLSKAGQNPTHAALSTDI